MSTPEIIELKKELDDVRGVLTQQNVVLDQHSGRFDALEEKLDTLVDKMDGDPNKPDSPGIFAWYTKKNTSARNVQRWKDFALKSIINAIILSAIGAFFDWRINVHLNQGAETDKPALTNTR